MGLLTNWQLKSLNPEARKRAAARLGTPGRTANVAVLVRLLDDPDPGVRAAASDALGLIGDPAAVAPLSKAALDTSQARDEAVVSARVAAVRALGRLGDSALPALADAVRDRNSKIREAVVDALASQVRAGAAPPLAIALRDDRSSVRQAAAKALGSTGSEEAERALLAAIDHKDAATRVAVAQALGSIASAPSVGALARALGDRDKGVRECAVAALGRIGSAEAIAALVSAFESQDRDVRQAAVAALRASSWTPADSRQRAVHAALNGDVAAAEAEGRAAVGPLVVALGDRDAVARRAAAEALGSIGGTEAVGPLVAALGDHDEQVRGAAGRALVQIGPVAAPAIIGALGEKSALVRAAAGGILAAIGEGRALAPLIDRVTHCTREGAPTTRPLILRSGVEAATLYGDDDVMGVRGAVETLHAMLEHAAARVPLPDLERIAALRDLAQAQSHGDAGARLATPEEISCEELRRLATLELARRRHDS
jgi:HEAT repeat protein